jgi:hypothetical protein
MLWIIGLIVTTIIMVVLIVVLHNSNYDTIDGALMGTFIDGLFLFTCTIGAGMFINSYLTRNVYINKYQQQEKQIVYNLETYSTNANLCSQFASAMSAANDYNLDIINEQQTYRSIGKMFKYRPIEVMDFKLIDVTKYKVVDNNMNISVYNK